MNCGGDQIDEVDEKWKVVLSLVDSDGEKGWSEAGEEEVGGGG